MTGRQTSRSFGVAGYSKQISGVKLASNKKTTDLGFVYDDGGREEAGCSEHAATDCGVRALSVFTLQTSGLSSGDNYQRCLDMLSDRNGCVKGISYWSCRRAYKDAGLKAVSFPWLMLPTLSAAYARYGNCIAFSSRPSKHALAIIDGNIRDDGVDNQKRDGRKNRERKADFVWYVSPGRREHRREIFKSILGFSAWLLVPISMFIIIVVFSIFC